MKNSITEKELTAYALNEVTADQLARIESALEASPELRQELADIQQMVKVLEAGFAEDPLPESQSEEFLEILTESKASPFWSRWLTPIPVTLLVLSAAVVGTWVLRPFFEAESPLLVAQTEVAEVSDFGTEESAPPVKAQPLRQKMAAGKKLPTIESPQSGALAPPTGQRVAGGVGFKTKSKLKSKSSAAVKSGGQRARSYNPNVQLGGRGERYRSYPLGFYQEPYRDSFVEVSAKPLSTFSIDVDTASYSLVRRSLMENNQLPPPRHVRIEEMINYFTYNDPAPKGDEPFSVSWEVADSPWIDHNKLVRIAVKGRVPTKSVASNLVFLVDVSGSMEQANKLPLLKKGLHKLVDQLGAKDRVALVVYAGDSRTVLESTAVGGEKAIIHKAIDDLTSGGGTNGSGGITRAYELARKAHLTNGNNRVVLATDGDFNVGLTSQSALDELIVKEAQSGVFLTILGFGQAYHSDAIMESLSNKGNGNYFVIDTEKEAEKVLVQELQSNMVTIAKDVKIQVEFNPANVESYRLIGYQNRKLNARDFNDDKKDAGEIGAGQSVVALYELTTAGASKKGVDPLKYQPRAFVKAKEGTKFGDQLLTLKLRYKTPRGSKSVKKEYALKNSSRSFEKASDDLRWAAGVAGFGMMLQNSKDKGSLSYGKVIKMLDESRGLKKGGYDQEKGELVEVVKKAERLSR